MPEAVIVDAVRTPDRPRLQGLAGLAAPRRDRSRSSSTSCSSATRASIRRSVEEVIAGCGMPQGLQAYNIGRIVVAAVREAPAERQRRRPSRATARPASTRSATPPTPSRPARATSTSPPASSSSRATTSAGGRRRRGPEREAPGQGRPARRLHRDGPDGRERRRQVRRHARGQGRVRPALAGARGRSRRRTASSTARSSRSRCADGTVVSKDDGPRASSTLEKLAALEPAFRRAAPSRPATRARSTTARPPR